VIVVASLVAILINFLGINLIDALFWTAVLNGLLAPPLLVLIMLVTNSKRVISKHTNGRWINLLGWAPRVPCSPLPPGWLILT
jgi:Mn2+/Fe2+ NRAMP family transporter